MPDFVRDTFDAPAGALLENHVPELGGIPQPLAAFPGGAMQINPTFTVKAHSLAQTIYQYPTSAPTADVYVSGTLLAGSSGITPYFGYVLRADSAGNNHIIVRFEQPANLLTYYVIIAGAVSSSASVGYTLTPGSSYLFEVQITGNVLNASVNGVNVLSANVSALVTAGFVGFQTTTTNLIGTNHTLSDFTANTPEPAPAAPMTALTPRQLTYCTYLPTDGVSLQKVTIYTSPMNIIVKGPQADIIWAWIQSNTPPDLVFGPL